MGAMLPHVAGHKCRTTHQLRGHTVHCLLQLIQALLLALIEKLVELGLRKCPPSAIDDVKVEELHALQSRRDHIKIVVERREKILGLMADISARPIPTVDCDESQEEGLCWYSLWTGYLLSSCRRKFGGRAEFSSMPWARPEGLPGHRVPS